MAVQSRLRPPLVALAVLLLLRSRLLSTPRDVLKKLGAPGFRETLTKEELQKALQQVYRENEDGSRTLLVPYRTKISEVHIQETPASKFISDAPHFPPLPLSARTKPSLDRSFLRQLFALLRVAIPSLRSKEAVLVLLHSVFLVLRTVLSIGVARLDGMIVRDLVSADGKGFLKGLGLWFALAIPSTYTNSMIRHLQSKLALRFRTRLSRYTHDLYLSSAPNLRYYRVTGEGGLEGVDQYITADVEGWSESLAGIYGNLLKPCLDLTLFTTQLSATLGLRGTVALFVNYYVTARILRAVTPAFGRLAAVEARLEGEYRAGVGRVGRESEEVAFYDGGRRERDILWRAYLRLIKHVNSIFKIRIAYEWTEDYVIKYLWSAAGYVLISIPVLFTRRHSRGVQASGPANGKKDDAVANRTENYISSRRLLLSLADAGGRLMYAYKDLLELAGLTARLYTLLSTLHHLPPLPTSTPDPSAEPHIALDRVDVVVPTAPDAPLVRALTLSLGPGDHLMITGSNGVGKTAVARVLAGLWAPGGEANGNFGGVSRPAKGDVFVVPQRAYMVSGSLLDQVIYPDTFPAFVKKGRTLEEISGILKDVSLEYLVAREGGWGVRKEWRDVLSGGEKQRMAMARVFYHRPKFAILDECTSAVSSDVEGRMYEHAKSLGITLITISLRPSLAKYHTQMLTLSGDGTGSWTLTRVGTAEERMGAQREISVLQARLAEVEEWEGRLKELDVMLGPEGAEKA
ncbi:ABC transporter transmembrane region 2-domain-containing protein [Amylostereum chailletii]|nr:ABC transporter transmembrane region 2-domain-containing protein [Amylostereum chailletii]